MRKINYGGQNIDAKDIKEVSKSLKNKLITTGSYVKKFEKKITKFLNAKYALSCNNGTSALHLSFLASGIKERDIIIMPIINFISSYNMCKLLGAKIFFADVDKKTGIITPEAILRCIRVNNLKRSRQSLYSIWGFPAYNPSSIN